MAHVAISWVRTLQGLHLVAFESESIMVSTSCLKEINRLRAAYRPDLKPYPLPAQPKVGHKWKLTGSIQHNDPKPKKPHDANTGSPNKGKQPLGTSKTAPHKKTPTKWKRVELAKSTHDQPASKARTANEADVEFLHQEPDLLYKFHSVDDQLQCNMCDFMGLWFHRPKLRWSGCSFGTSRPTCNQTYRRGQ